MQRLECLRAVYPQLEKCVVVTIMGAVAVELQSIGHRPNFFYLQHAMGLASSTGLGLALALPEQKVVVLDGDGSLLMNLGTLSTMARSGPRNLTHVVFDNQSYLSAGDSPTATSKGTDLEGVARASGIPRTAAARTVEEFVAVFRSALDSGQLTTLVAHVDTLGPSNWLTELGLLENRFEFARYCRSLARRQAR
jgi:sulfopyruvate decarboxylase subunit beta